MAKKAKLPAPFIIGVGGRTCSGKSTVVHALEEKYRGEFLHINQDKFYKKSAENSKNRERPEELMLDRLISAVKLLKRGRSVFIPSERFTEAFDREVKPHKIIIVEGFLLFVNKELNSMFDKKIWVDVSDINLLYRKIKRSMDLNKIDYYVNVAIPESKKYEKMQKSAADVVVDGNLPKDKLISEIEMHILSEI